MGLIETNTNILGSQIETSFYFFSKNLSLYLNEIEKIVNLPSDVSTEEEKQYKLKILESYISNMGDIMKVISSEGKNENIILS